LDRRVGGYRFAPHGCDGAAGTIFRARTSKVKGGRSNVPESLHPGFTQYDPEDSGDSQRAALQFAEYPDTLSAREVHMKRLLLGLAAVVLLGSALVSSGTKPARPEFDFQRDKLNPVSHLRLNNDPNDFQFVIVSDRTGGHRAEVFSRAIEQINLLQPEFVVCVGDLIEGYTADRKLIARQWREFQGYISRLQMPFFYVPGNHDLANPTMATEWKEKFGRSYYEFLYRDVLFLMLNSEDPPGKDYGAISDDQLAWLEKTLAANPRPRWTLVFLHKPMWSPPDRPNNDWLKVEKLLAGRNYTVFAGHVHRYQKFVRQGQNHYMLATTGGASMMRGVEYGEFDHLVWATIKKDGPVLANILLDGILREDLAPIGSDEKGVEEYYRRPTHPFQGRVTLEGKPIPGAYIVFRGIGKEPRQPRADGTVEADGTLRLSTYTAFDGIPVGEYAITIELRKPFFTLEGAIGPNLLPAKYADPKTSGLTYTVKPGKQQFDIELKR
jgi:hypothetical protein